MKVNWRRHLRHLAVRSALPIVLSAIALGSCSGEDPIREKERLIAERNDPDNPDTPRDREETVLYSFEHWGEAPSGNAQLPALLDSAGQDPAQASWISPSNVGFAIIPNADLSLDNVPLSPLEAGFSGRAIRLRSREGFRFFGIGSWLVAGSVYTGALDRNSMVMDPSGSTKYGIAWGRTPLSLSFHYRYKAGARLINGEQSLTSYLEGTDMGSITAVFYDVTDDTTPLTGRTLESDPRIVSRAVATVSDTEGEAWQERILPFEIINQDLFDRIDHANRNYRLAIILNSSYRGGSFIGAIDSELHVDELKIVNKANQQ